jgi:transcriptional regulator with XRE-family HTH domain
MTSRRPATIVAARILPLPPAHSSAFPPTASPPPAALDSTKLIHFGQFIRHHRLRAGKTTEAFGKEIGLTGRRVIGIEAMATPDVQHTTLTALARALHFDPEELDTAWRTTPVPLTARRAGPTTESAQRFAAACRQAGISPAEGMRRLRRWLIAQDEPTQQRVLRFEPLALPAGAAPLYTDLVDHLQDPAEATRQRIAGRAARPGRPTKPPLPPRAESGKSKK